MSKKGKLKRSDTGNLEVGYLPVFFVGFLLQSTWLLVPVEILRHIPLAVTLVYIGTFSTLALFVTVVIIALSMIALLSAVILEAVNKHLEQNTSTLLVNGCWVFGVLLFVPPIMIIIGYLVRMISH